MANTDRLTQLMSLLGDGALHTAHHLAARTGVSERTIYRDMDRLQAAGVPISGTRGIGYCVTGDTVLPPLTLSQDELDALNLGLAVVAQAGDAELAAAAASAADKIDATLPQQALSDADSWKTAFSPLADMARGLGHISTIRSAINARQKLRVTSERDRSVHVIHPLRLYSFGRMWLLNAWNESTQAPEDFRVDLLSRADAPPELFTLPD